MVLLSGWMIGRRGLKALSLCACLVGSQACSGTRSAAVVSPPGTSVFDPLAPIINAPAACRWRTPHPSDSAAFVLIFTEGARNTTVAFDSSGNPNNITVGAIEQVNGRERSHLYQVTLRPITRGVRTVMLEDSAGQWVVVPGAASDPSLAPGQEPLPSGVYHTTKSENDRARIYALHLWERRCPSDLKRE